MKEYIIAIGALLLFFMIKSRLDEKKRTAALLEKNKNEYGHYTPNPPCKVSVADLVAEGGTDEGTWNDLDLESLFSDMNTCGSSYGERVLYGMLRTPLYDRDELYVRGRLIDILDKNEDFRNRLKLCFQETGRSESMSVNEGLKRIGELSAAGDMKKGLCLDILALCLGIFAMFLIFINPMAGFFVFFAVLFFNLCVYFIRKKRVRDYLDCFAVILRLINNVKVLARTGGDAGDLAAYTNDLLERTQKLSRLTSGSFLLMSGRSATGSLFDVVLDYFRMFLHLDLIRFYFLQKAVTENADEILALAQDAGMLDACIAIASWRKGREYFCEPEFSGRGICISGLVHPLVKECVPNDIRTEKSVLLTGSNASGKSTFLRSVSLAAHMSQTVYTVCGKSYRAPLMRCATSMALSDDVRSGDSYYMAEIKSLKRIMELSEDEIPLICAIDEVLRGTNTAERVAASAEILKALGEKSLCFAATHDLELATILEDEYDNYHFTEDVDTGTERISFSYKLMPGRATSRNAIKLLTLMGYDEGVTRRAALRCDRFLKDGIWEQ